MFGCSFSSSGPGMKEINAGIAALNGADALVGIPEGDDRQDALKLRAMAMALSKKGTLTKKARKFLRAAQNPISNAELLFIFSNGSPLRGQPPRVVIEAAIETDPTKDLIAKELAAASVSALNGDEAGMMEHLDRAGQIGESASKAWFTDSRNGWPQNAPSTIRAKSGKSVMGPVGLVGMDASLDAMNTPGIDTGQMRRAITHITETGGGVHEGNLAEQERDGGVEESSAQVAEGVEAGTEAVGEGIEAGAETVGEDIEGIAEVAAL